MPRRLAVSTLQGTTIDILNTIRANASTEYQELVPKVEKSNDIPRVGEVLFGYPALANQFINALINRIALVRIKSALFNNPYVRLKKGFLEYGETVEEIFINLVKVQEFDVEKAPERELKRTLPDVQAAFHAINWEVQYPVTIQDKDLMQAFLNAEGVTSLIAGIIDQVYQAAEYDEFLLFKYLMIKAITSGKAAPISVGDITDLDNAAVEFRSISNLLTFRSDEYNAAGVLTVTPRENQVIFMDARFNARFDVNVLASAFNMDKANFIGSLYLIDRWDKFDNKRFEEIVKNTDMIEPVTADELALMKDVVAVAADIDWFQFYDNLAVFTETYVAAGMYWNYFYNVRKTVSSSPFSNFVAFVAGTATITNPANLTFEVTDKSIAENATVLSLVLAQDNPTLEPSNYQFVQTQDATEKGIAVHKYGAIIFPPTATETTLEINVNGSSYTASAATNTSANVGDTITFAPTVAAASIPVKAKSKSN